VGKDLAALAGAAAIPSVRATSLGAVERIRKSLAGTARARRHDVVSHPPFPAPGSLAAGVDARSPSPGGPGPGRRGSRSDAMPATPELPVVAEVRPSRPTALSPPAPRASRPARNRRRGQTWLMGVGGVVIGGLLAYLVAGALHDQVGGFRVGGLALVGVGVVLAVRRVLRRRATPPLVAAAAGAPPPPEEPPPAPPTDLECGLDAIRGADRGFQPAAFAGYAGMMFRDVKGACAARDADPLHDRLTPEMHAELRTVCDGLRMAGRSIHVDEVDVGARITEAWQDGDQDYVTACVVGTILSHVVDDATRTVVSGSRSTPSAVTAFLTFTRPAGLNPWRLSLIQKGRAPGT
jgi:predicted lipid-binding transport protein (Tim44 family)